MKYAKKHTAKYLIFTLSLLINTTVGAQSLPHQPNQESRWQPITIMNTKTNTDVGTGYITENNELRIERIIPIIALDFEITSKYFGGLDTNSAPAFCEKNKTHFYYSDSEGRKHTLRLKASNPADFLSNDYQLVDKNGETHDARAIKQKFASLSASGELKIDANSYSRNYSNKLVYDITTMINAELNAKMPEIIQGEPVDIELTGHDYLICDLLTQKAKIALKIEWRFDSARLHRETVIDSNQLLKINTKALATPIQQKQAQNAMIVAAAVLGATLPTETRFSPQTLSANKLLTMFNGLFNSQTLNWNKLSDESLVGLSRQLDDFYQGETSSTVQYRTEKIEVRRW